MVVANFFSIRKIFLRNSKNICKTAATKEEWEKQDRNNQADSGVSGKGGGEESLLSGARISLQLAENKALLSCPSAAHEGPCWSRYLPCVLCEGHHMEQGNSEEQRVMETMC